MKYRTLVTGTNYIMMVNGVKQRCGFYAIREVEAGSRWNAMNSAVHTVLVDARKIEILNHPRNPPVIYAVLAQALDGSDSLHDPESVKKVVGSGSAGRNRTIVLKAEGFKFYREGLRDKFVHCFYWLTNVPSATHHCG